MADIKDEVVAKLKFLKDNYLMSSRDIAEALGVEQCTVVWWNQKKIRISYRNYEKLNEILLLLSGQNIRYKKQALDFILEQRGK